MIKAADFEAEVRRLAAENPDHIYKVPEMWHEPEQRYIQGTTCVYVETDEETGKLKGSCILGQALINLGVDADFLYKAENNTEGIDWLNRARGLVENDGRIVDWATDVQGYQDNSTPWGEAVELADENWSAN